MRIWWVFLAVISCIVIAHSELCSWDYQCDSDWDEICCMATKTCTTRRDCPCKSDFECNFGEKCSYRGGEMPGFCYADELQSSTEHPYTTNPLSRKNDKPFVWKPFTNKKFSFKPHNKDCVWDSDCRANSTCRDGKCVQKRAENYDASPTTQRVIRPGLIAAAVVIHLIIFCCIGIRSCTKTITKSWHQQIAQRHVIAGTILGEVATSGAANGHGMQSETAVVEVEDDSPLPPGGPPPYSSLQFEKRQNTNGVLLPLTGKRNENTDQIGDRTAGANEHEVQSGSFLSVVEVGDNSSCLPDAPLACNTFEFERQENVNEDLPEEPPPCYDEAVRNFETMI